MKADTRGTPAEAEAALLVEVHRRLERRYDLDRWHWREDTPALDVCLGAILVQHTSWTNVEKALTNLQSANMISVEDLDQVAAEELAVVIRPAGTPLTKALRLKAFVALVQEAGGLEALLSRRLDELRPALVATPGIGPETADCICLYAARLPTIAHDAYTERLLGRIGAGPGKAPYRTWQAWLLEHLPREVRLYQRFHAAIVVHCKETCRARPNCEACPLLDLCSFGQRGRG
jgi:endonuclease III related protein